MSSDYPKSIKAPDAPDLAEVWGDIVRRRELITAIAIGAVVSLAAYWAATLLLAGKTENADIGKALAMLVGVAGCVISGVISAFLIKPKREVLDETSDDSWRNGVLDQLASETGTVGHVSDLSPAVAAEMKEVGVYDLFESYERRQETTGPDAASPDEQRKGL
jgi:hypothetical protein